jgi:hypothetical protein
MKIPQWIYTANIEEQQRFMALLVQQMQADLSDNGWQFPQLNNAMVGAITDSAFLPVMRVGTSWINTDTGKLQFISVQAIPAGLPGGPVDATVETITSV